MSYNYRSPIEKVLNLLPSESTDIIATTQTNTIRVKEERLGPLFNFSVSDSKKKFLSEAGIYISPYAHVAHSHPACKLIENHLLFVVVSGLLNGIKELNVVSMKSSKLKILHSLQDEKTTIYELINRLFDVKDSFRYSLANERKVKIEHASHILSADKGRPLKERDKDPLLSLTIKKNGVFLFHDEMHYWSKRKMFEFLEAMEPSEVVATVVYPVEILNGVDESMFPDLYQFRIMGDKFIFAPDGQFTESYEQSIDMRWLFEASSFKVNDTIYSVDIIKTIGAHHVFAIVKGHRKGRTTRLFDNFDMLDMKTLSDVRMKYPIQAVRFSFFKKVVNYLQALNKPDTQSAVAKLRQLAGDDLSLSESLVIEDFARRYASYGASSLSSESLLEALINSVKCNMPKWMQRIFKSYSSDRVLEQIANARAFHVKIKCREVSLNTFFKDFSIFLDDVKRLRKGDELSLAKLQKERKAEGLQCDKLLFGQLKNKAALSGDKGHYGATGYGATRFYEDTFCSTLKDRAGVNQGNGFSGMYLINQLDKVSIKGSSFGDNGDIAIKVPIRDSTSTTWRTEIGHFKTRVQLRATTKTLDEAMIEYHNDVCSNRIFYIGVGVRDGMGGIINNFGKPVMDRSWQKRIGMDTSSADNVASGGDDDQVIDWFLRLCEDGTICLDDLPDDDTELMQVLSEHFFSTGDGNWEKKKTNMDHGCNDDATGSTFGASVDEARERLNHLISDWNSKIETHEFHPEQAAKCAVDVVEGDNFPEATKDDLEHDKCDPAYSCSDDSTSSCGVNELSRGKGLRKYFKFIKAFVTDKSQLIDLENDIRSVHQQKLRNRMAVFFCSEETFDYGHDKVIYKNMGWPSSIESLTKEVEVRLGVKMNSALCNIYPKGSGIPFHADDEHVYDLDCNPVFTLNLTGSGVFEVQFNKGKKTTSFNMQVGDAAIMFDDAQKYIKHSVKATEDRISITLRVQRRDMAGNTSSIPLDVSTEDLVKLKNNCFLNAISEASKVPVKKLFDNLNISCPSLSKLIMNDKGLNLQEAGRVAVALDLAVQVMSDGIWINIGNRNSSFKVVSLILKGRHFVAYDPKKFTDSYPELVVSGAGQDKSYTSGGMFIQDFIKMVDPFYSYVSSFGRFIDYERAFQLYKSLLSGSTGVISSSTFGDGGRLLNRKVKKDDTRLFRDCNDLRDAIGDKKLVSGKLIMGFAGCGKSQPVQIALQNIHDNNRVLVVTPRARLMMDWKEKVNRRNVVIRTFEVSLKDQFNNFDLIILDEADLFPPGYVDLIACKLHYDEMTWSKTESCTSLLIIGDPLQASYHSYDDAHILTGGSEIRNLGTYDPKYLMFTRRMAPGFEKLIDVKCLGSGIYVKHGVFESMAAARKRHSHKIDAVLVASRVEKELLKNEDNVMTFGEAQGLTFNNIAVSLSESTLASSNNSVLVALTRARNSICFIQNFRSTLSEYKIKAAGTFIGKILSGRAITIEELKLSLNMDDIQFIYDEGLIGSEAEEDRLSGDPYMKALMSMAQAVRIEEVAQQDIDMKEPVPKIHVPIVEQSFAFTSIDSQIRAREYREMKLNDAWSTQFKDCDKNINNGVSTGPVNFEAIFPRHKGFDDVTFWMAVKKRLRFSNPMKEKQKLDMAWNSGGVLFNEFSKKCKPNSFFRQDYMERAQLEFEEKRLAKSPVLIERHAGRSDPDWNARKFLLFMKSQLCKKAEKAFCDAKAGQTLACFAHSVLFKFSVWCRYAELKIREVMPDSFYIHSQKNFDEMEEWVKRNYIGPVCIESDYEAFDASQDEVILAFEIKLLRAVGWPEALINDYIDLKLDLGCKLGNMVIMRFTGEFGTFFFNTMANMAFTFCRYHVNKATPVCFAGDDMCILADVRLRSDLNEFMEGLRLKAKVDRKASPMFCGWLLSRYGIIKLPSLIYHRMSIAKEKGNLRDCIDSYMIEAGYGYRKGALMEELIDEEQMAYHQLSIRMFIKHKHLMRGQSVNVLKAATEETSDGCD
ncbi:RdRp protein [Lettuce chordovirus 1]|uniref:RdRp protein n=1 Tax=Lettuce chordovirus 1 TaxID=2200955 RepID=A0A2S1ZRD8_9VIRU|nr:RdRp protein [Lettuce chordovirus 1]AWK28017.1 RdRp protein [Lettuce chordovirus 1]